MRQVFSNIVANALEAVGENGRVVLHSLMSRDWRAPEKRGVRIIVADDGQGISPEQQKQIWKAFFTTKGEKGTGLGLWVSFGIVQKHHGCGWLPY